MSFYLLVSVNILKFEAQKRDARTDYDVGLGCGLLNNFGAVVGANNDVGVRVALPDRLGALFGPHQDGVLVVWVLAVQGFQDVAADEACCSGANFVRVSGV